MPHEHRVTPPISNAHHSFSPTPLYFATALLGLQLPMPLPFPAHSPPALPPLASSSLLKMLMPALSPWAARKSVRRMRREEADGWFHERI